LDKISPMHNMGDPRSGNCWARGGQSCKEPGNDKQKNKENKKIEKGKPSRLSEDPVSVKNGGTKDRNEKEKEGTFSPVTRKKEQGPRDGKGPPILQQGGGRKAPND